MFWEGIPCLETYQPEQLTNLCQFILGPDHKADFIAFPVFPAELLFAFKISYPNVTALLKKPFQQDSRRFIPRQF